MVTVVGDPGVGKSRLREEFLSWIELRPESSGGMSSKRSAVACTKG